MFDELSEKLDAVFARLRGRGVLTEADIKEGLREGFLDAMSTPETSAIPVLTLPDALKMALLDELSAGTSWRTLFEELVGQIGAALASAGAFVVECCCGPEHPAPPAAVQADATL